MGLASELLIATALVAGLAFVSPKHTARATTIDCESDELVGDDLEAARKEVQRVADGRTLDWKSPFVCVLPHSARIFLEAPVEPQADGSEVSFHVSCQRHSDEWKCEPSSYRTLLTRPGGGGRSKVALVLPPELEVTEARALLQQVVDLAPTLDMTRECSYDPTQTRDPLAEEYERGLRRTFSFPNDRDDSYGPLVATIRLDGYLVEVQSDYLILRFERDSTGHGPPEFSCWGVRDVPM